MNAHIVAVAWPKDISDRDKLMFTRMLQIGVPPAKAIAFIVAVNRPKPERN